MFLLWCLFLVDSTDGRHCLPHNDWASSSSSCYGSTAGASSRSRRGSQRFASFLSVLLGLVALSFFLLGGWGSPCRVFPFPRRFWLFFLWVGWVPLPRFPGVFPMVLGRVGGRVSCFVFLFLLLFLASCIFLLLQLGQHGLPTRKPPGPPPALFLGASVLTRLLLGVDGRTRRG